MRLLERMGFARSATSDPWSLERRLLSWSRQDHHTIRDSVNGIFVTGMSGSGKSSGPSAAIAKAHLSAGFGGIFFTVKPQDTALALAWCRVTGRTRDVILFGPRHPMRFNFLSYEYARPGAGAGLTDNIVDHLLNVAEIRDRKSANAGGGGGENAQFFANAARQILRVTVDVLTRAKGSVSVPDIYNVILSAPTSPEQFLSPQWRKDSFCYACMAEAVERGRQSAADPFRDDLELAGAYWCSEFPAMADRTRSSIVSSVSGTIDTLNRGYLRQLLCQESNFTPELLTEGKVLILDMPVLEYGEVGAMAQTVVKFSCQKAIERRDVNCSPRPVFFHLDEFQTLITKADCAFASTCRSARASLVLLTQTLPTVFAALGGGDQARQEISSLAANLNLKIFCATSDPETAEWASKLAGKVRQFHVSANRQIERGAGGFFPVSEHGSAGVSEVIDFDLQPAELTKLQTGGPANKHLVDTILFRAGAPFRSSNRNWMRVTFDQK
jgi:TraM recognition site of TraD and TraG